MITTPPALYHLDALLSHPAVVRFVSLDGRSWDEMPPERPMVAQSEQEQVSCG